MNAPGWTISIIAVAIAVVLAIRWERASSSSGRKASAAHDDGSTGAYEFMSEPWVAMARREITNALSSRDLDVEPFTLSEEFTDAPQHLRRGADTIGFSVRVGSGRVDIGDGPEESADFRVISDYAEALQVARNPDAGAVDPEATARRIADGRLRIVGDPARTPKVLQEADLHRLLSRHTA